MDLKQFFGNNANPCMKCGSVQCAICSQDLGLFFWERGGKQFAYDRKFILANSQKLKDWIEDAKENIFNQTSDSLNARDFLDALACLGEEKIKELIKKLKGA